MQQHKQCWFGDWNSEDEKSSSYDASSDKYVIFISIVLGCPLPEGQNIDRARRSYRDSKGILLILEKIVIAADKYHCGGGNGGVYCVT